MKNNFERGGRAYLGILGVAVGDGGDSLQIGIGRRLPLGRLPSLSQRISP